MGSDKVVLWSVHTCTQTYTHGREGGGGARGGARGGGGRERERERDYTSESDRWPNKTGDHRSKPNCLLAVLGEVTSLGLYFLPYK